MPVQSKLPDPLAIAHVALATVYLLRHPRRHQLHYETRAIKTLVDRYPVHRGRLHRRPLNSAGPQPCRHLLKIRRKGIERPNRIRKSDRIDRDIANVLADVDSGTIPGCRLVLDCVAYNFLP